MQILGLADSTPKPTSRVRELFWPRIDNGVAAVTAARNAMYASFLVAAGSTLAALVNPWGWLDVALFLMIGFGVRQFSRTAALAGLWLYAIGFAVAISTVVQTGAYSGLVLRSIVTAIYIGGVRAAFFAHKLENAEEIRLLASPGRSTAGMSRVSLLLEEMPRRAWPVARIPFYAFLGLITAVDMAALGWSLLRELVPHR